MPMLYIYPGTILLVILGSAKDHSCRSMVGVSFLFLMYAFICAHDPFSCLITVVLTLQFKWSVASSSWTTAVIWDHHCSSWAPTTQIRRGREPTTGGSYANTIMCRCSRLPNGQALSTQAQRSALTHFPICPLLDLLLSIPSIASLRALTEPSSGCFQVPTLKPFPIKVH